MKTLPLRVRKQTIVDVRGARQWIYVGALGVPRVWRTSSLVRSTIEIIRKLKVAGELLLRRDRGGSSPRHRRDDSLEKRRDSLAQRLQNQSTSKLSTVPSEN
jgi:hypothetical protein